MDTTPKYILMCEKAVEVQKAWVPMVGDWVRSRDYKRPGVLVKLELTHGGVCQVQWVTKVETRAFFDDETWLPRQDQLQTMTDWPRSISCSGKLSMMQSFYANEYFDKGRDCYSMEQLWLAFVMKERYSKVWSEIKKDWVHEKN